MPADCCRKGKRLKPLHCSPIWPNALAADTRRYPDFIRPPCRADSGDTGGAVTLYEQLAQDSGLDNTLREAAKIYVVMLQLDDAKSDGAAMQTRLESLMKADGAWRHAARELSGLLALRSGDGKAARGHFRTIADNLDAPQGMRARSVQILAVIGK